MRANVRFIQIDVHLLVTRVSFGAHAVLNVVKKTLEALVDDETSFALRLFESFVLILSIHF